MRYSFKITVRKYERSPVKDIRTVCINNITLVAKNSKFGGYYRSKYVKKQVGRFAYAAGSNAYPVLIPINEKVELYIVGFPSNPLSEEIMDDQVEISDVVKCNQ